MAAGQLVRTWLARQLCAAVLLCAVPAWPQPLAAQAAPGASATSNAAIDPVIGPTQGVASYYGDAFQGRPTASGEIYDKEKMTCAHRTLPFGTLLRVINLDTEETVVVRVNDRGPFVKGRILDLSEAAARLIGMLPSGTARVSFMILPPEEALAWKGAPLPGANAAPAAAAGAATAAGRTASSTPAAPNPEHVRIQVASYSSEANAMATITRLKASGLEAVVERSGGFFRVVFPDLSPDQAAPIVAQLERLGYRGMVVTTWKVKS